MLVFDLNELLGCAAKMLELTAIEHMRWAEELRQLE